MAALAGLGPLAHGGAWGALAEALLAAGVAAFFLAVWLRERRRGRDEGPAALRNEDGG